MNSPMKIVVVGVLALTVAIIAPLLTPAQKPAPGQDISALFDPLAIGAGLCRGGGDRPHNPFSGMARLAASASAFATESGANAPQPLWDTLGDYSMPVSTNSPEAQSYFDQGLRLTYGFNHAEAIRAYRMAQNIDGTCAMCYWGEALAWGPNINAPMPPGAMVPALAALDKAVANKGKATGKEQAMIEALATRYADAPGTDQASRDKAYAEAMGKVAAAYPDDQDIAVLYAESLMDTTPWDYWEADFTAPNPAGAKTIATLEGVLEVNPRHAGAIHLYIHITEASTDPRRAEPHADRLAALVPGSGHLVHMPSHTYYRIGRFLDSLQSNINAALADEAYIAEVENGGVYALSYYPHNVHFLMTSALMAGDGPTTLKAAAKLDTIVPDTILAQIPWVQPIKAAPYFAHAQFSPPETVLALPEPEGDFPYIKAIWHYARGTALAKKGRDKDARAEALAIVELRDNADFTFLEEGGVPVKDVLTIAEKLVEGRLAHIEGDQKKAIALFTEASDLEIGLPYTEPPYWYYPVRQTLGAALIEAGRYDDAVKVFTSSLLRVPNNGWALFGLQIAQRASGDGAGAAQTGTLLTKAWAGNLAVLQLSDL